MAYIYCTRCGKNKLSKYTLGNHCFKCQKEIIREHDGFSDRFYDSNDLAEMFGYKNDRIIRIRKDEIPGLLGILKGKKLLWHREAVERWIESDQKFRMDFHLPLLDEAFDLHNTDDTGHHDWMLEEKYAGLAFKEESASSKGDEDGNLLVVGCKRACCFCGYERIVHP